MASLPVLGEGQPQTRSTPSPPARLEKADPSADLSDYREVQDSQGNRYKIDSRGNVLTKGQPNPRRQPASAENVIFYYNYAVDLMNNGYTAPALEVYREILALPGKDEIVLRAQQEARKNYEEVRSFKDNAEKLDRLLFVVRHVEDGRVVYHNERYRFRIRYPVNWSLENEVRNSDANDAAEEGYASLALYPLPLPAPDGGKVRMAIGFHADRLKEALSLDRYRERWVAQLQKVYQAQDLKRHPGAARPSQLRDRFEVTLEKKRFAGEDVFMLKGKYGYYLTYTATPETFEAARGIFDRFLSDFEVVP